MAPHELFAAMSPALSTEIFEYTHTNDKQLYHGALDVVAQLRKVRPIFLERQPRAERYATMRAVLSRPNAALAADNLIRNWLLKKHNAVLIDFLDSLKIKHEKGVVQTIPPSVDDGALKQGIDTLLAKYPAETVALYLHAFNDMDEARWKNLDEVLANDSRLKLGGT